MTRPILAQTDAAAASSSILWWLGAILAVTVVLLVLGLLLRRWLSPGPDLEQPGAPGFTLGDLRDMHAQGRLTDAEYENAKKGLIARSRAMIDAPAAELPAVGEIGEDLAARGTGGVDLTTDAAKHGRAEPEERRDRGGEGEDRHP